MTTFSRDVGGYEHRLHETLLRKYLAVPGLIIATSLSLGLLAVNKKHLTFSSGATSFVTDHQSLVGIFVQIISHFLGLIHTYTLCTTINLSARAFFANRSFSLDLVKLVNALSGKQLDWSLPWRSRLILLAFFGLTLFPAALWAGALTPVGTSQTASNTIQHSSFSNTSWLFSQLGSIPAPKNVGDGIFTFNPAWDIQGLILNSATSSSSRTGGNVSHPKLDRTQYSYINRSYGVGAAVGLTDRQFADRATTYSFYENGFQSSISCIYNETSDLHLSPSAGQPSNWLLQVYEVLGRLPNSPPGGGSDYVAATMAANPAIVALTVDTSNGQNLIGITTNGDQYASLNNTQCEVTFVQRNFSVAVDILNRTILVTAMDETTWLTNTTIANKLTQESLSTLYGISTTLSTALYVNPLGSALVSNIENVQAMQGISDQANLTGIEAVLTSIIDDTMGAFAAAQIMLINDIVTTDVVMTSRTYIMGTAVYLYAIVVLNAVIMAVYVLEALRTRGWRAVSRFDFMDVKSVIIAASEGGTTIGKHAQTLCDATGTRHGADGNSRLDQLDRLLGRIYVRLGISANGIISVLLAERDKGRVYTRLAGQESGSESVDDSMVPLRYLGQPMGNSV